VCAADARSVCDSQVIVRYQKFQREHLPQRVRRMQGVYIFDQYLALPPKWYIENRTQAFKWYHFQWLWVTLNPDLKVTSNNSEMVQEILNLQWRRPIVISKSYRTAPYSATHSKDGDFLTVGPVTVTMLCFLQISLPEYCTNKTEGDAR